MPRSRYWSCAPIDISGQRFGSWTVVRRTRYSNWEVRCDCGTVRVVQGTSLKNGTSKRCFKCASRQTMKHGMEGSRIYNTWAQIKRRCLKPKSSMYVNYGGRGIAVCERWLKFEDFYSDMGDIPKGKSIGRIDNDGPYSPENCRWETHKQQMRNRRNTAFVIWQGRKCAVGDVAEVHGLPVALVRNRLAIGWSIEKAVTPSRKS